MFVDAAGEWKLGSMKFVGQFSEYSLPTKATLRPQQKNLFEIGSEMRSRGNSLLP